MAKNKTLSKDTQSQLLQTLKERFEKIRTDTKVLIGLLCNQSLNQTKKNFGPSMKWKEPVENPM